MHPTEQPHSDLLSIRLHRRLYLWLLSFAQSKHATWALFLLSFAESSFFPIAPDVLQIAMTLERRGMAWYYAFMSTIASVLGGLVGYAIGFGIWHLTSDFFFTYIFREEFFEQVGHLYNSWGFWAIFIAAFTPVPPYKVFTIAAGVFHLSLGLFFVASLIGRAGRFFIVAALLWRFGPSVKTFIEKYFNLLTIGFIATLVCGFLLIQYI